MNMKNFTRQSYLSHMPNNCHVSKESSYNCDFLGIARAIKWLCVCAWMLLVAQQEGHQACKKTEW